jgi:ABC-type spermidine/putrescine transport system permease subunit I
VTSPKESGTPGTITAGYWLVVTGVALSVLASIFLLANKQAVVDAVKSRNTDPKLTPEMIEASATATLVIALVVTVVLAVLAVWFVGKVKAGKKKSRTGLMIALLLDLFFQLIANGYAIIAVLVAISGLVLLYFRQSTDYLAEREQLT